jgi:DNA polymerase-3 subunit beta
LPGDSEIFLRLNAEETRLIVESAKSHFELAVLVPDDYPAVTVTTLPSVFKVPSKTLLNLFDRTAFAMSTEETRYYLNGIYVHATEDGKLRAVATDGHRMARMQAPLPKGAEGIPGVIISRKTIAQIQDMGADLDQDLEIGLSETQISVRFQNAYLISRLVDGQFPEYERIVPKNTDKEFNFDPLYLSVVVDRVATMASEKTHGVKLDIGEGKIGFSANGSGLGTADEEMLIDYAHDPISLGFNSKYLLDIADKMGSEGALMSFSDEASPVMIQGADEKEAMYVLMPMRI